MPAVHGVFTDLEQCSSALLDALRRRDPLYLDHLQRRQELLREIARLDPTSCEPAVRACLERSRILGNLARTEALRMRLGAATELAALEQERQVARGLRWLSGPQNAMLDVKA